ncbi:MAG: DNA polymerase domain-containing protein [Candidatus Hodarchaeota archaeon]
MNQTIRFVLLDADYEMNIQEGVNWPLIRLWGRIDGKRVEARVSNFLPYFYAEADGEEIRKILAKEKDVIKNWLINTINYEKHLFFGGTTRKVTKLIGNAPYLVPELRRLLQQARIVVHETDIPFTRRFMIDQKLRTLHPIKVTGRVLEEESDSIIIEASYDQVSALSEDFEEYQPIVLAFDIEVDEHGETIHELLSDKKRRITAISLVWGTLESDNPDSRVLILENETDKAERELLNNFLKLVNQNVKPDVLISFNGTFFDIPYLTARMSKYGKSLGNLAIFNGLQDDIIKSQVPVDSYRLKGRAVVDLMPRTWGIHHISGKKNLDTIAEKVLGEKKIQLEKSLGKLWRDGIKGNQTDAKLFYNYSLQDAILTFRLGAELGVLDNIELCRLSGYPLPEGIISTSRNIGELELMRILHSQDILIPSKPSKREIKKREELKEKYPHLGGWVIDPSVNEATFVAIMDFRSLYPNIVRQHNISGETLIPNSEDISPEHRFKGTPRGALAKLMDRVLNQRYQTLELIDELKNQESSQKRIKLLEKKQNSLKLMANSLLGASNYPRGRFYHYLLSNSITGIARSLLSEKLKIWTRDFSKKYHYDVFLRYGDTDSIFVEFKLDLNPFDFQLSTLKDVRIRETNRLLKAVNEYRGFLSKKLPEYLELKLEDIALRIILKKGRKKAYAYLSLLNYDVVIKGFEAIRSDWSPLAKKTQKKLLKTLLADFTEDRERKARIVVVNACQFILRRSNIRLIQDLSIRGPLRRSPIEYRSKTPAVGAFLHFCRANNISPELEWKKWDGFPYVIAKGPSNQPQYQRAFHPDVFRRSEKEIDRMHYVREILGASNRFGIQISENEAQEGAFIIPLTVFLEF